MVYIYTMEYYSAVKKSKILPLAATWMDLEGIMLSEISQRKTNTICYHLYVESKKYIKLVNKTKKRQTYRYREQTLSAGRGKEGQYRGREKKGLLWNYMKSRV